MSSSGKYTNITITFVNVKNEQVDDIVDYVKETFPLVGSVRIELYNIPED